MLDASHGDLAAASADTIVFARKSPTATCGRARVVRRLRPRDEHRRRRPVAFLGTLDIAAMAALYLVGWVRLGLDGRGMEDHQW